MATATMKTRAEHLDWCKIRALDYARKGDASQAMASMASDLNKHPGTRGHAAIELGMMMLMTGNLRTSNQCVEFINGIN